MSLPIIDTHKDIGTRERHGKCWRGDFYWMEFTLQESAKNLPTFEMPIAGIPLDYSPWDLNDMEQIAYHVERCSKVDLSFPIIFDSLGVLRDGHHRLIKSILEGKTTILAVRLKEDPPFDGKKDE